MADHVLNSSAEVASKAISLRAELKTWEKEFASTHDGRKAGREDIKQHPDIGKRRLFWHQPSGYRLKFEVANICGFFPSREI